MQSSTRVNTLRRCALSLHDADGDHIIHYTSAVVVPGISVALTTATTPSAPAFRLRYELTDPGALAVRFETAPPGGAAFHPIATGTLHRAS